MIPTAALGGFGRRKVPFTVAGGDPYIATRSALLHMDGSDGSTTFTDVTGKTWTAAGNAQIDTAQSVFGGASALFDGSGDRISTAGHAHFDFGTADWTIQWWQRWNSSTGYQVLFDYGYAGAGGLVLQSRGGGNEAKWELFIGGSSNLGFEATAATLGVDYHYAVVMDSGTMRIYRAGVQTIAVANAGSVGPAGATFCIGSKSDATLGFNGWVDEFMVNRECIYPGGTGFAPPSSPFSDT